ncbi:MAG TPA: hypothetical protein VJU18_09910 [Vicinamibacteria bacterium]|nr:hypothetical protein [Vicinamibacteria bacterium]
MTSMLLLLLAASSGLTLHLTPEQNEILVGEPLRLNLTWHVTRTLQLPAEVGAGSWSYDYLEIWANGPGGRRQYREAAAALEDRVIVSSPTPAGSQCVSELLLFYGYGADARERPEFLFPAPGTYTLMVRYPDDKNPAESNTVTVRVKEPEGGDRAVLEALKNDPFDIKLGGPMTKALLEKHPDSHYLRLAKITRYRDRESRLRERRDPETGAPLANVSSEELGALVKDLSRRMTADLKQEKDWGAWEDVRLGMLVEHAKRGDDAEDAAAAKRELFERFPKSRVADHIRDREAKDLEDEYDEEDGEEPRPQPTPKPKQ